VKRVLVLDKDPFIRYLLARTLQSTATVVVTLPRIEKAVAGQKACNYDLLVVDIQTLNNSVFELLRLLKELSPHANIMLMSTAFSRDELPEELHKIIYCFIPKPFLPSEIRKLAGESMGLDHVWTHSQSRAFAELRQHERFLVTSTVEYTLNAVRIETSHPNLRGDIINISDSGIGMLTAYPITSGDLLTFSVGMERYEGIVVWSRLVDLNLYRAGIVFV
jgi:DNA-binding response OmpR family regulator